MADTIKGPDGMARISGKQLILIIEDSDDDYFATQKAFKKAGLLNPIRRCSSGDQAIDYLFRRGEFAAPGTAPRPAIILLDLNLPGLDGRDVLRLAKSDQQVRRIPIIVLTTSSSRQDIERCYADGANTYVQKPVDIEGFLQAVCRLRDFWLEIAVLPKETG